MKTELSMPYHHDINALLMVLFWCRLLGARRCTAPHRSTECKSNTQVTSVEYEFSIQVHGYGPWNKSCYNSKRWSDPSTVTPSPGWWDRKVIFFLPEVIEGQCSLRMLLHFGMSPLRGAIHLVQPFWQSSTKHRLINMQCLPMLGIKDFIIISQNELFGVQL